MKHQSLWIAHNDARIFAGTTTRNGGVSTAPFASLNFAFHTGDNPDAVKENRQRFANLLGKPIEQMVFTYQSHSTILKKVTAQDGGRGKDRFEDGIPADALYTTEKGLLLAIFHADCVPVFILHKHLPLVAIIHAGTEGSLKKVTELSIKQLVKETGVAATDLIAILGPSLDFAHHPITLARQEAVLQMDTRYQHVIKKIGDQRFLDIPLLNYIQLVDAGLKPNNIHVSNLDTFSNPNEYFSFDRDNKTGRHISFIYLR
jgi:polyphenol oxidase